MSTLGAGTSAPDLDVSLLSALVAHGPTALVLLTPSGRVLMANGQTSALCPGNLTGQAFASLFVDQDQPRVAGYVEGLAATASAGTMFLAAELAGEARRYVHVHGRNLARASGHPGLLLTLVDGTEARRRESDLEHRALHDSLTGLPNRSLLLERVRQSLEPGRSSGAVLLVDLDGFKKINDTYGHSVGDQLLVEVAGRLQAAVPGNATVARLGGDEFAVLLPDTSVPLATMMASSLCADLRAAYAVVEVALTASIGVAELVVSADAALREADIALYAAKGQGRDRVVAYDDRAEVEVRAAAALSDPLALLRAERDRLHRESRTDALTGLANRRALDELIGAWDGPAEMAVLFVDLDHFGDYNHRYGDLAGDRALRKVARAIADQSRRRDRVFRKGGEELCIVLSGAGEDTALLVGERVRAAVEALAVEHGGSAASPYLTVTVGVAARTDGDVAAALATAADAAFVCKNAGRRNQVSAG